MQRRFKWSVATLTLAIVLAGRSTFAQEPPALRVALVWDVPAGCVDRAALEGSVAQHLARDVFVSAEATDVTLRVSASDPSGQQIELVLSRGSKALGSRSLAAKGADCARFRETVSLVVSMLIDTSADELAAEPEPEPAPAKKEPARRAIDGEPIERPPPPPPPKPAAPKWKLSTGVSVELASGLLPSLSAGARADVAVEPATQLRLQLAVDIWPEGTLTESDGDVVFRGLGAALGVGLRVDSRSAQWRLFPQLELGATALRAQASGFAEAFSITRWLLSVGVGARFEVKLTQYWFWSTEGALRVGVARPTFEYRGADGELSTAFQPDVFGLRAGTGFGLRF